MYFRSCSNQKSETYSSANAVVQIISAKNHLENLQNTSRDSNHTELSARQSYQAARNNYKKNHTI